MGPLLAPGARGGPRKRLPRFHREPIQIDYATWQQWKPRNVSAALLHLARARDATKPEERKPLSVKWKWTRERQPSLFRRQLATARAQAKERWQDLERERWSDALAE